MKNLIIRYTTILIGVYVLVRLIAFLILFFIPDFLTFYYPSGRTTYDINYLVKFITYILNISIACILYLDMKKQNHVSYLILIVNVFSSYIGVMFYIILNYKKKRKVINTQST